ncbi:MAG TPA: PEP-utilizing enzyme [Gammaproteobacteria bacterium]|nr:PEP-utilizing enzyme [Gammaproteobacteria bacterium]
MSRLYGDSDKYGDQCGTAIVEAFHGAIRELVRRRYVESGQAWNDFVFGKSFELITAQDFAAIDRKLLDYGHRYAWSALKSQQERPEAYVAAAGIGEDLASFSFEHPEAPTAPVDAAGLELRGCGDNVVKYDADLVGTARYVRSSATVLGYLENGVPPGTIAVIDDSGGTLTAPILEQFAGVLCAGGTVRSHLGILTREYGIPCFMNSKLSGIREGDTVRMECTATAKTAEAYQKGVEMTARVWRVVQQ